MSLRHRGLGLRRADPEEEHRAIIDPFFAAAGAIGRNRRFLWENMGKHAEFRKPRSFRFPKTAASSTLKNRIEQSQATRRGIVHSRADGCVPAAFPVPAKSLNCIIEHHHAIETPILFLRGEEV